MAGLAGLGERQGIVHRRPDPRAANTGWHDRGPDPRTRGALRIGSGRHRGLLGRGTDDRRADFGRPVSIHAPYAGPGSNGQRRAFRITSYNVCYTKLLRKLNQLFYNYQTVSIMLILFGILFIVIEKNNKNKKPKTNSLSQITYNSALIIGIFQLIAAVFPGTSRSGATILGGLLIGVSRTVAAEFTFFLAIPVMFGASLLKILKFGLNFSSLEVAVLLTGLLTAFLVSIIIIKFLMEYIKKHDFKVFGWYRIILGVTVLVFFGIQPL